MLRKTTFIALLLLVLAAGIFAVSADDDEVKKVKAKVYAGGRVAGSNDSLGRVGEYKTVNSGAEAGFKLESHLATGSYLAYMKYIDSDDMFFAVKADVDRAARIKMSFNKFIHRLEHDPLTNLQAVKSPKATRYTDTDPGTEYGIVRSEFKANGTFQHPDLPGVVFDIGYRQENRQGHKQTRAMSHCTNCHIVGYNTYINQLTKEYNVGARVQSGGLSFRYTFNERRFEENGPTPMHQYTDVLHPTLGTPVFNDRASFSDVDGLLPHNMVPDNKKQTHKLTAVLDTGENGVVNAGAIYSTTTNEYTDGEMTFTSFRGGYAGKIGDLGVRVKGLYYTIENDDYYVDITEPVAVAGTYAGQTYAEKWGAATDFNRQSIYNRDVVQLDAEATWRPMNKTSLVFGYRHKEVDREFYEVGDNETKTTSDRFQANFNMRPGKGTKINAVFSYETIDLPFVGLKIAGTQNFDPDPVASPLAGGSIQYFQLYEARLVDLSNQPTEVIDLKGSITHKLANGLSVNGKAQYSKKKNDALNYSEWSKDRVAVSGNLWFAPTAEFYGTVSYQYVDEKTETLYILPIFDG